MATEFLHGMLGTLREMTSEALERENGIYIMDRETICLRSWPTRTISV